jgi:hypothetical protein
VNEVLLNEINEPRSNMVSSVLQTEQEKVDSVPMA